jgi:hypothetical protein
MAMGLTLTILDDVLQQIAASDDSLKEARRRRDLVLDVASRSRGTRRTYGSGSVAAGLVNDPVDDADGGVVLDRRAHPTLGPDSSEQAPPDDVVEEVRIWIGDTLRDEVGDDYPNLTSNTMKRGVKVLFGAPINDDEDPHVDLAVAVTRKDAPGLWIPRIIVGSSSKGAWTAADPERHRDLLLAGPPDLRRLRARVIRLGKAWKHRYTNPGLCSFNVAALGLEIVTEVLSLDEALRRLFEEAGRSLTRQLTADPAGISPPIKIADPPGRDIVVARLKRAAANLARALEHDDDEQIVREALHSVFPNHVDEPEPSQKASLASALGVSTAAVGVSSAGRLTSASAAATPLKHTRSFGDGR